MPLRPSEKDYFLTWMWFFICTTAGGMVGGALVGAAVGAAFGALRIFSIYAVYIIGAGSFIVSAVVSFALFRVFVRRLVARIAVPATEPTNAA